jgi:formylmethanofuran dehydrogenase subunit C
VNDLVTLTLRAPLDATLELEGVAPDRFAELAEREIAAIPVWLGGRAARLGDFFDVSGERATRLRVVGDLRQVDGLGAGTAAGELVVEGDAGRRAAARMTGGSVEVHGSVGDDAGLAMAGGTLHVSGNAGDRVGGAAAGASRGMTGGEIVVVGSVGAEAGVRARRGLVAVGGDAGERTARAMIAGNVVVLGRVARDAGVDSKRGTIVAVGEVDVPATYRYACTFRPPHVRLTMRYLRRRYGLAVDERAVAGQYRRYCGDAGDPGKGEILAWTAE